MENRGIDPTGRRMRHPPWPVDSRGCYRFPSVQEQAAVYGISGAAVKETLCYFEQCRGRTPELVHLLNTHAVDDQYHISRSRLLDESRWYTNEYYFYFQMFAKKLIGRYDWHFGEASSAQLSGYHKIWEKGFLRYMPYAGPDKDAAFSMIKAMFDSCTARGIDCRDIYEWAECLCCEKTAISFKNEILHFKNTWLCSEFWYYLIEFVKIVSNVNSTSRIVRESFDYYELEGFSFVPEGMLLTVLQYMLNRSTSTYRMTSDYDNKGTRIDIRLRRRPEWDAGKTDKYFKSASRNGDEAVVTAYGLVIMKFFRLDVPPKISNVRGLGSGDVVFTIQWEKRMLPVPYLPLLAGNLVVLGGYAAAGVQQAGLMAGLLLGVNGAILAYRYVKYMRYRVRVLKTHLKKQITQSQARVEQAEGMTLALLEEKTRLVREKQETARRLRITEVYTKKSLVDMIAAGDDPTRFPSRSRKVSVLFADINNFTGLSENRGSLEIVALLNRFFDRMNQCIISENGEIDKLIGDGIMAVFDDPDSCLRAAIQMGGILRAWNRLEGVVPQAVIKCGIGINFGEVVVGNIGSRSKMDYTVIGDIVNSASRLEALTRIYNTPIIISESFKRCLRKSYHIQFLDVVLVKGRKTPIRIYEVYDHLEEREIARKRAVAGMLETAFGRYQQGRFEQALAMYSEIAGQLAGGGDNGAGISGPVGFYRDRCRRLLYKKESGLLDSWDGICYYRFK